MCVNLYPFERTIARYDVPEEEAIEQIDVGGPTMIRAAAKNHRFVAVVVKPESYDAVLGELEEEKLSAPTRHWLANEAFAYTARYDAAISRWFGRRYETLPQHWVTSEKELDLTYGENPHQQAAPTWSRGCARTCSGWRSCTASCSRSTTCSTGLGAPAVLGAGGAGCVIVKHNNPCRVAEAEASEGA